MFLICKTRRMQIHQDIGIKKHTITNFHIEPPILNHATKSDVTRVSSLEYLCSKKNT